MKKRLRILKLRVIDWIGFKLTSDERSEICYWITRNVTKSNEETLSEVNGEVIMANSGDGVSDSLITPREQVKASSWMPPGGAQIAWETIDWDAHIENSPKPKKISIVKMIFRCIGRSKVIPTDG